MFLPRLAGFYSKSLSFYLGNFGKNLTRSKLVKLLPLLHVSPRIRSIMRTTIVVQILLYKYCYMQCNLLFSHVKNCVLKIISNALFEFKSKENMRERCSIEMKNSQKKNLYKYILLNFTSLIFLLAPADEQTVKE